MFWWSFFFNIYLFLERGEGREKGRGINVWLPLVCAQLGTWPATQACDLTGNPTGDSLVCRLVLNPLNHTSQGWWSFTCNKLLAKLLSFAIIKGMGLQINMNISILSSFLTGGFFNLLTLNSKYLPTLVSCVKCVVCLHQDACCDFVIVCCLMRYYIGLAKKSILLFQ